MTIAAADSRLVRVLVADDHLGVLEAAPRRVLMTATEDDKAMAEALDVQPSTVASPTTAATTPIYVNPVNPQDCR